MEPRQDNLEQGLRHQLGAGQMAMVAVGGSIGTGLLLGSGAAIGIAGPGVILSFLLAAFINWTVSVALGELASVHPAAGSFGVYGELYLNQWAGFIARAGYWLAISASVGVDMVASATYMAYWFPTVPPLVWVFLFAGMLMLVNRSSVGHYGTFEYWFAMIKVVTIFAFIAIGAGLLFGHRVPAQYTVQGGFLPMGPLAPLLAMSFALYTFAGVEFVAVTTGESRSPAEIPRAVFLTLTILTAVYLGAIIVLVGVMPWNRLGVTESPFVTVFRDAGIPGAGPVMNFVVLTAALSGSNAALYIGSRMLFASARSVWVPPWFGKLNASGVPTRAVWASSYGILLAIVLEKLAPGKAFVYILDGALFGLLASWMISLVSHVAFRRRLSPAEVAAIPYRSHGGVWSSVLGIVLICIALVETWYASHVTLVTGVIFMASLTIAYFLIKNGPRKRTMNTHV